ncbi:hypothetical protein N431DRAFT_552018 [Stipitochalara longipes BDJ]|nr:hypothetical protein N431DRAFT_552018 [Stipitochalara longipes BDJ]
MELSFGRNVVLSILLIACILAAVEASPTTSVTDIPILRRNATSGDSAPLDCTTQFSNDYYGFGVRLGVYFSWLGSYFANLLLPSEISGSLDTNSIFLVALIGSLFNGTRLKQIQQIDALVIMQLSSGFLFSCFSIWGYRTSYYQKEGPKAIKRFGGLGTHCRLILVAAISVYGTWFWWEGLDDGLTISDNPECQEIFTWFFAYLPVRGGIDKLYIVITIGCSLYYCTMLAAAAIAVIFKLFRVGWKGRMTFETGFSVAELKFLYHVFRIYNLFWIIFCALMVEMTLNKNNMLQTLAQHGNIQYPSQLLPLLIGTLSFIRVMWLIYREGRDRVREATDDSNERFRRHETMTKPSLRNGYGLHLAFLKILSPSRQPHNVPIFELEPETPPSVLRPWYQRYLVALFPWLSTFESWKLGGRTHEPDIERSAPAERENNFPQDVKIEPSG